MRERHSHRASTPHRPSQFACILALLITVAGEAVSEEPPSDSAAERRMAEFIDRELSTGKAEICVLQQLGTFEGDTLIGLVIARLLPGPDGKIGFCYDIESETTGPSRMGRPTTFQCREQGELTIALALERLSGYLPEVPFTSLAPRSTNQIPRRVVYNVECAPGGFVRRSEVGGERHEDLLRFGRGISASPVALLGMRLWVRLPVGISHRLRCIHGPTGSSEIVDIMRMAATATETGETTVLIRNHRRNVAESYLCRETTGHVRRMSVEDVPVCRRVSDDEVRAWRALQAR